MKVAKFLILFVVLMVSGCIPAALVNHDTAPVQKTVCVVRYDEIVPGVFVGRDGCGNRWLRAEDRCAYWNKAEGVTMEFGCPAEGDTLYAK